MCACDSVCACQFAIPVDGNALCSLGTALKDVAALPVALKLVMNRLFLNYIVEPCYKKFLITVYG